MWGRQGGVRRGCRALFAGCLPRDEPQKAGVPKLIGQSVKEMPMTNDSMLAAFLGLELWNWILIVVLLVAVVVLLQLRKRQQ